MGALKLAGVTRMALKLKDRFAAKLHNHAASDINSGTLDDARIPSLDASKIGSGTLGVARGGTGASTHTANAVLTGNGTSAMNNVATASGALYATAANGAAQFGTLPVAQGGTGGTTAALARTELSVPSTTDLGDIGASIADVESTTATANHAAGDYFMLGNVLMRATSAIATGEQITTSNATPATVQSQIDTLRDSVDNRVVTSQENMHGRLSSFNAPDHLFGIGGVVVNTNNAAYKGHRVSLVVTNTGINLYDHNSDAWVWAGH